MNVSCNNQGQLVMEVEDSEDWQLLREITHDALSGDDLLSTRLGALIQDPDVAADWSEYVLPDLEENFRSDLQKVAEAVSIAHLAAEGEAGQLVVSVDDRMTWYSALNQARLAIEERQHFGGDHDLDPRGFSPSRRRAYLRSQFYSALQSLLLDLGLG